jgi:hypothetical protein
MRTLKIKKNISLTNDDGLHNNTTYTKEVDVCSPSGSELDMSPIGLPPFLQKNISMIVQY